MKLLRLPLAIAAWIVLASFLPASLSAQSPLLELTFDNTGNRLANTGSSGTTFSSGGSVTYVSGIDGGTAANFNGSSYLLASGNPITSAFSITFWMKTTAVGGTSSQWYGGNGIIDGELPGDTADWGLSLIGNKVAFGIGSPDRTLFSSANVNTGAWVYVAATWNSATSTMNLYINGVLDQTYSAASVVSRRADNQFQIGHGLSGGYYAGALDEIQFYSTALTPQQILNVQNYGSPVPEPSTYAAVAGGLALIFVAVRRRWSSK